MRRLAAVALCTFVLLTGCSSTDEGTDGADRTQSSSASGSAQESELLAKYDLAGLSSKEIIEQLDQSADKPKDLMASVRYDELVVSDPSKPGQETSLPIEQDFYLSMAPYVDSTHDCYNHSLTTCQGELTGKDLDVKITGEDGTVLVDETLTTYSNGFVGVWLPRDITGTLEVSADGRSATTDIATGPEDPTCLTTLKLA